MMMGGMSKGMRMIGGMIGEALVWGQLDCRMESVRRSYAGLEVGIQ